MRGLAALGGGDLLIYKLVKAFPHVQRRYDEFIPYRRVGVAGKHVEESRGVGAKGVVGGKKSQVCVDAGCRIVIVAGAQMYIAANAVFFLAYDQGDFGMGFQAHQAVDDMRAGFFQAFGPLDVVFFVKAGF